MSVRRLVLAHGFTQTAKSWDTVAELLRGRIDGADIEAVDMPGHGSAADVRADLWESARRLGELGGHGVYVGYSMGGRVALHTALMSPPIVERMVLIGASAGIDDADERRARAAADDLLADRIEQVGVATFIDEWLATPLFSGLTNETDQRQDRLRNTAAGLASSLRATGTGTQEPLWDRLGEIDVPVLVLAGEHDHKFTELGMRLAAGLRRGQFAAIANSGHSAHLEAPEATVDTIVAWLGTH